MKGNTALNAQPAMTLVVRQAEQRTIDLLLAAGVEFVTWALPAEMFEPHIGDPDQP